jgi:CarD family transcriptional regulator
MATKSAVPKMKYAVGDKVVYPMHGVGFVQTIEKRTVLGTQHLYYIIHINCDDMKVMLPVDRTEELGLRPIVSQEEIDKALDMLVVESGGMNDDWKIRFNINKEKIKTGSIFEVTGVVRDLFQRNKAKELSSSERKLYENAHQLLVDEISLKLNSTPEYVENLIAEKLEEGFQRIERKKKRAANRVAKKAADAGEPPPAPVAVKKPAAKKK